MIKRLFAAIKIEPDEDLLKVYCSMQQLLKHEKIRWVKPNNLHLTLKFFGETPETKIETINKVLASIASGINSFDMTICKTGIFGSSYNPKVIWFGFEEENLLKEIGNQVLVQVAAAGFSADRQNFVPHLTIGRIKQIQQRQVFQKIIDNFKEIQLNKFRASEFHLYESILKPDGPVYLPLQSFQFAK